MVALTFPDGARREFPNGTTGLDIAKGISPSLAKRTVAMALDGTLADLTDPIEQDAKIEFIAREDPRALELIRHDAAHVLAEAVQTLWPGTQVTIGPVIENGFYYDFFRNQPFTPEDFATIEKKMREIIARDKPFTKEVWDREKTKQVFRDKGESFKVELVDAIPGNEPIKIYRQGDWFDLCRGPHMTSTGKVGNAFRLMKVAGAYWRGDANNPMLTRIYGTAFATQAELDAYLKQLEEAEKRDHRRLGRELDLFHFQEEGPGVVFWHSKGWSLFQSIIAYMRRRLADDYEEVNAPQMLDKSLWETSGHWGWYRENMFAAQSAGDEAEDKRWFAIKPMNCPGHVQIFKHGLKSYRDLPIRLAEFGMVHRYEPSGALHGLLRVRGFTQDDAHIFCTEEQLAAECLKINDLILSVYADFGFTGDILIKLATRPEKRVGTDAMWDHAEGVLRDVLKRIEASSGGRIKTGVNPGEGTFYGPKFEYVLRDAIGRDWQCGTTQVDFNLPERFGAFYIDANGEKKQPIMVHRAICGSLERFTGILIENYAGHFPLWLAPRQIVIATITSDGDDYAREVLRAAKRAGLRAELDLRNEKINFKVREHSVAKVPVLLVVGKKEAETRQVSIRRLGSDKQTVMPLDAALAALVDEALAPDMRRMEEAASGRPTSGKATNKDNTAASESAGYVLAQLKDWLRTCISDADEYVVATQRHSAHAAKPPDGDVGAWSRQHLKLQHDARRSQYHFVATMGVLLRALKKSAEMFSEIRVAYQAAQHLRAEGKDIRDMIEHADDYESGRGRKPDKFFREGPESLNMYFPGDKAGVISANSTLVIGGEILIGGRLNVQKVISELRDIETAVERIPEQTR